MIDSTDYDLLGISFSCWNYLKDSTSDGLHLAIGNKRLLVRDIVSAASGVGVSHGAMATAFLAAGCDYIPSLRGVGHGKVLAALWRHSALSGEFCVPDMTRWPDLSNPSHAEEPKSFEKQIEQLTLLAYLENVGKSEFLTKAAAKERQAEMTLRVLNAQDKHKKIDADRDMRSWFVSDANIGREDWRQDVRRILFDIAKSTARVVPAEPFVCLQALRVRLILVRFWGSATRDSLMPCDVGGLDGLSGYTEAAEVLFESPGDVVAITTDAHRRLSKCGCGDRCDTCRCPCRRASPSHPCVGCDCMDGVCANRLFQSAETEPEVDGHTVSDVNEGIGNAVQHGPAEYAEEDYYGTEQGILVDLNEPSLALDFPEDPIANAAADYDAGSD